MRLRCSAGVFLLLAACQPPQILQPTGDDQTTPSANASASTGATGASGLAGQSGPSGQSDIGGPSGPTASSGDLDPEPSIESFTANDSSLIAGESVTLSWQTTHATSVQLHDSLSMNTVSYAAEDGSSSAYTPVASVSFTLTAMGPGGQVTATADVTVTPPVDLSDCGGILRTGSVTHQTTDGVTHTYYYRVPSTLPPVGGRPVLFWLHGDGGSGNGYGSGFYASADADGAILITPSGIGKTWTHAASDLAGQAQDSQFISWIMDDIVANGVAGCASINAKRMYLGGESRGAYMPYFLMQRVSTRGHLAAVAANAGLLYCQNGDTECEASTASPTKHSCAAAVLHLHGTNDSAVSPAPTAAFHAPVDWGVDWRVFSPMKFFAAQNGCFNFSQTAGNNDGVVRETTTISGNAATRYDLSGWGASCSRYQLLLVTNGGHVIGGQHSRIWNFLKQYSLP